MTTGEPHIGSAVSEGTLLWMPSDERKASARLADYERWLAETRGLRFESYEELWRWSVGDVARFWASFWDYFGVRAHTPYREVLASGPSGMHVEGAHWFSGATLNYAEHALTRRGDGVAIVGVHESGSTIEWTWTTFTNGRRRPLQAYGRWEWAAATPWQPSCRMCRRPSPQRSRRRR